MILIPVKYLPTVDDQTRRCLRIVIRQVFSIAITRACWKSCKTGFCNGSSDHVFGFLEPMCALRRPDQTSSTLPYPYWSHAVHVENPRISTRLLPLTAERTWNDLPGCRVWSCSPLHVGPDQTNPSPDPYSKPLGCSRSAGAVARVAVVCFRKKSCG